MTKSCAADAPSAPAGKLAAAGRILADATKIFEAAEISDAEAEQRVRAFLPRHELFTLRQQWHDLAQADAELPGLETAVGNAAAADGQAKQATGAASPDDQRKLYQRAQESYRRVAKSGAGDLVQTANNALGEIDDSLKKLDPSTPQP